MQARLKEKLSKNNKDKIIKLARSRIGEAKYDILNNKMRLIL